MSISAVSLIDDLVSSNRGKDWLAYMNSECIDGLISVNERLAGVWRPETCYPDIKQIFTPFHVLAPCETKLVMICKEPYRGPMATGIPIETANRLATDSAKYFSDLIARYWTSVTMDNFMRCYYMSGILVINASFTTTQIADKRYALATSHYPLWADFTKPLVRLLLSRNCPVLTIGEEARKLTRNIESSGRVYHSTFPRDKQTHKEFIEIAMSVIDAYVYNREERTC